MEIILIIFFYFLIQNLWKRIKSKIEKLEEYNGEFIYTFLNRFWKKEIYFNLSEIRGILFSRMTISGRMFRKLTLIVYLSDGYTFRLQKKEDCILLLKSCRENDIELYNKVLKNIPMGIDISSIVENEIEEMDKNK